MTYKEPKKEGIKLSSFWIAAIASALSKQHKVNIKKGDQWAMDMKTKTLIYTDDICFLDQDNALALLLHEIGHLKYSEWVDETTEIYKKFPETSHHAINAIEDTRIDYTISREYENSMALMDTLNDQSLTDGLNKLKEYDTFMRNYQLALATFQKELEKWNIALSQKSVTPEDYSNWVHQNEPKRKMELSKVREIMYIFLCMYSGKGDAPLLSSYYNQIAVDKAKQILKKQEEFMPEFMDSTLEVQGYYEKEIFPILEDQIDKDSKGNEKKTTQGQTIVSIVGAMKERMKEIAEKVQAIGGRKPTKDAPETANIDYDYFRKQIEPMVNTSAARLNRILKDNKFDRLSGRFKSGELNKKRLFKHKTRDYRLFQRPVERLNKEYAFSMLLDCSESMSGAPIRESMKGIVLMSEVLNFSKIPFEARFFSSESAVGKTFNSAFSRKKMSEAASRVWNGGTYLTEVFRESVRELANRKEQHKICIVLTDGEIDEEQKILNLIRKNEGNISFYGIGIGVDLKELFAGGAVSIRNASEIVPEFGAILKKHIKIG